MSVETDDGRVAPGRAYAPEVASLGDATILQVRMGVLMCCGLAAALIGMAKLVSATEQTGLWERAHGIAYASTAAICFLAVAMSRTPLLRTSEVLLILAAYLGTASVIITGSSASAIIVGVASYSIVVLQPGVTLRIRSSRTSVMNVVGVCIAYVVSVLLRALLHDDREIEQVGDFVATLGAPPIAFAVLWLMARALNRRILGALEESERARHALRHALDQQVALNDALVRFVPQEFLTSLGRQNLPDVQIGDSVTKTMSILFADIYGYTSLVEGMDPDATVRLLNDLFGALEPAIHDHHGFVDSYIGDAIMALFDGSPRNAIDGALAMLRALRRQNENRCAVGVAPIAIGIGINTGPVTLGTIGGPKRLKCSVFGDNVNLAARIEHLTRRYSAPLLVSEHTLGLIGAGHGYDVRVVDRVRVVGRSSMTTLFEIYDADPEPLRLSKRRIDVDYHAGIALFYGRRFAEALAAFERCYEFHDDGVVRAYIERSRALLEAPPDDAWTGVETLNQK